MRGGPQHALVFIAEHPAFAGVRVERADRETGRRDSPPPLERGRGDAARFDDALRGHACDDVAQRQVCRHEDDAQTPGRQHHGDRHVAREMREKFRHTWVTVSRGIEGPLAHGTRDDGIRLAAQGQPCRCFDRLRRGAPSFELIARGAVVRSPPPNEPHVRVERLPQRLPNNLRPDPSRIAYCNRQTGP